MILIVSQPPENRHGALAPDASLLIFQRVNVKQTPARCEQAIYFVSSACFQVVPGDFRDIQLPEWNRFQQLPPATFILWHFDIRFLFCHDHQSLKFPYIANVSAEVFVYTIRGKTL